MDRGAWWTPAHGVAKSQTGLSDFNFFFSFQKRNNLEKEEQSCGLKLLPPSKDNQDKMVLKLG